MSKNDTKAALAEMAQTEQQQLEAKKKRFRELLEEGLSNEVISNRLGISRTTVTDWAREAGAQRRRGRPPGSGE